MKNLFCIASFAAALLLFQFSTAYPFGGPLKVKNQFPLFMTVNPPYLETASPETFLSISLSHSSVFMVRSSRAWTVNLDMELTELALSWRKDMSGHFEIGIDLPLLSFNSGFMDDFLESYHSAFGFPDYGRSARPNNDFLYEVRKNGALIIKGESGGIGVGDIKLTAKKALLTGDPYLSIRADLEIPAGNAEKGYGSGSLDGGIAVLMDKRLGEKIKTYLNLGVVFPGDLKGHETIRLREYLYAGAGLEYEFKKFALLGQIFIQGSPFPKTDISVIDRTAVLLTLGGRYSYGRNSFEFSLTEDPSTSGAPDFTLAFSFKRRF